MFLIRRLEEEAARAYATGKIGGFLHLYIGQEAVGVGAIAALKPEDYVVTTYRDHGIVGGHIPLAAGVAFASKYRADGRVTLCLFGEGAVSIGGFHEGLSLAALWKLPIVFICENNEYS